MARGKKGDESTPRNSATAEQTEEVIKGIEAEKEGLLALHMEYMQDCRPYHERVKSLLDKGVKVYGMTRRAIQAKVKERDHLRKADSQRQKLDSEEAEAFDIISEQLGDLGRAAREGFRRGKGKGDPLGGFAA